MMKRFAVLCAGVLALAALPAAASQHEAGASQQQGEGGQHQQQQQGQQQTRSAHGTMQGMEQGGQSMDVSLAFIREATVLGAEGEEIGEVGDIVRSTGERQGLSAVVNIDSGWFGEERQIIADLNRFTITDEGYLRLEGATEESIEGYEEYADEDWEVLGDEYETYEEAYEGYGWEW